MIFMYVFIFLIVLALLLLYFESKLPPEQQKANEEYWAKAEANAVCDAFLNS